MNKFTLLSLVTATTLYGGGDITPIMEPLHAKPVTTTTSTTFLKDISGYLRAGYQQTDIDAAGTFTDMALGGKLHLETNDWQGLSLGTSLYTTNVMGQNDGNGVPFFDANNGSYTILGEVYMQGEWDDTLIKIGRQEIDTPFLDTDDIGMVPNTFEAAYLINQSIPDTTLTLAHVTKMAGVDANDPSTFDKININDKIQIAGLEHTLQELHIGVWYYHLDNPQINHMLYMDLNYNYPLGAAALDFGLQYAHRNYKSNDDADLYGAKADLNIDHTGLTIGIAYNTSHFNIITNGFGGGPFYTSSEHQTIREANVDGKGLRLGGEWHATIIGLEALTAGYYRLQLEDNNNANATEHDVTISYALSNDLTLDGIYSRVDDTINGDKFTNLRVFVNYLY